MGTGWDWLGESLKVPEQKFAPVSNSRVKPTKKDPPLQQIASTIIGARTDAELRKALVQNKDKTVLVNYGSSWCAHCHEMFPQFYMLSKEYPQNQYVVAQVDFMNAEVKNIKFTPTFAFFKRGRKVDEFYGVDAQRLKDHLWLHSDS